MIRSKVKNFSTLATFRCNSLQEYIVESGNSSYSVEDGVLFDANKSKLISYPVGKQNTLYQIPSSVKEIGENAFDHAKVSEISIPRSVTTIGSGGFAGAEITTLTIPDSVKNLGSYICEGCTNLQTVKIGNGLTGLSYRMFYNCSSLTNVTLGSNLKQLDALAFAYCTSLKQIVIPNNVTTILNGCFGECSALTNVTFPKNLEMIAYQGFLNCKNLTSVILPNKLKKINELSFYGTGIKKANIPSSVTFIGANAFPSDAVLSGVSKLTKMDNNSYLTIEKLPIRVTYDYKAAFEVMKLVNNERAKAGLKALEMDQRMIKGAMLRAAELAIAFSHTRPSGRMFNTVCHDSKQGYIMMGENIAAGQTNSQAAMTSWMNSSGHKKNILTSNYTGIGVGAVKVNGTCYWVQNFYNRCR